MACTSQNYTLKKNVTHTSLDKMKQTKHWKKRIHSKLNLRLFEGIMYWIEVPKNLFCLGMAKALSIMQT